MPEFTPEQYQFIGWAVVTLGGILLAAVIILRKLGVELGFKKNGAPAPASNKPGNGKDIGTIKANSFAIKRDTEKLLDNDRERAQTLKEIRDYSRDSVSFQKQVLDKTRRQTDELTKALRER